MAMPLQDFYSLRDIHGFDLALLITEEIPKG